MAYGNFGSRREYYNEYTNIWNKEMQRYKESRAFFQRARHQVSVCRYEGNSVAQANGGLENMINWDGKDKDLLALIKYIADEDKLQKVMENPSVIKTPVVRNGKLSTLGYQPEIWKKWQ